MFITSTIPPRRGGSKKGGGSKRVFKGGEISGVSGGSKQVLKSFQGCSMSRFLIGNEVAIRIEPYQEWFSVKNSRVDTWTVPREPIGFWAVARKLGGWCTVARKPIGFWSVARALNG